MNAPNRLTTSSRRFDTSSEPQAVGLGIVAAMSINNSTTTTTTDRVPAAKVLLSGAITTTKPMLIGGRTKSIPIQFSGERRFVSGCGGGFEEEVVMEMEMEMDMVEESYTCVTAKIENDRVRKREYFDEPVVSRGVFSRSLVVDVVEIEETSFWGGVDFLSSCFLCRKDLRGIDIFMYRGEKAFCSVECRDVQIPTDKRKEKRGRVRVRSMEHSESPCCSPMLSYTGVAAA